MRKSAIVPSKTGSLLAITRVEYDALQVAFEFINNMLFMGMLRNVAIVYGRRSHSSGHFAPDRFTYRIGNGGHEHELSLNPDTFIGKSDEWIVSILLHEMCHLWQHLFGKAKRKNYSYHDKEWAAKMMSLGLMPSNSGAVGGKITGQKMSHYIITGGAYQNAFAALAATGWKINLQSTITVGTEKKPQSKIKFVCPSCASNMWGKPDSLDICGGCNVWRKPEVAEHDA